MRQDCANLIIVGTALSGIRLPLLAHLLCCVVEVHDNVEDLEKSSDNVDEDNRLIFLQKPIIQPAHVTVET